MIPRVFDNLAIGAVFYCLRFEKWHYTYKNEVLKCTEK